MSYTGEEKLFFQMGTQKTCFWEKKKLLISGSAIDVG